LEEGVRRIKKAVPNDRDRLRQLFRFPFSGTFTTPQDCGPTPGKLPGQHRPAHNWRSALPHHTDWHQNNAQRSVPMNVVNLELYQSALRSGSPVLSTDSTGLPIVRCAVAQDGRLIGYLLSPGYGGVPTQEQLDLLGLVSDLCALRMQKELHYAEYPEDMLEFFLQTC
jgi:hypothetical protein